MTPPMQRRREIPGSPFNVPVEVTPIEHFEPSDRVSHDRYGLGTVIGVEGDIALTVQCGDRRVRVTSPFRSLEKL